MVKEKPNSTRVYDGDGYRRRAACLCFRDETEKEVMLQPLWQLQHDLQGNTETRDLEQLLLVSGSKDPKLWIVPGGGIEPTEDAGVAAMREVLEEAGVKGTLGRCLGVFENEERKTRTSVFVCLVTDLLEDWDDAKSIGRKRQWFNLDDAREQLGRHKPVQQNYLELLKKPDLPSS